MDLETLKLVLEIIGLAVGLIGGIGGVVFGIVQFFQNMKGKSAREVFETLKNIAMEAMSAAESSGKTGADKKTMVLEAVQAGAQAAGIEFTDELEAQISAFIDKSINFANTIK